ncbi:MAG: hypothetical protein KAS02_00230 [Candidatus Pacebacteria bacterium]|nr:hypothetical protein [Candidatus Paceibacterota bacterium]
MDRVLTAEWVSGVFMECIFKRGDSVDTGIFISGISLDVGFHPDRIRRYKGEIAAMLDELPDGFREGEGALFVDAYIDKNGRRWTCISTAMEYLFQLGLAIGKLVYQHPYGVCPILPGGLPRYKITEDFELVEPKTI